MAVALFASDDDVTACVVLGCGFCDDDDDVCCWVEAMMMVPLYDAVVIGYWILEDRWVCPSAAILRSVSSLRATP